jgi:hypothetical protein
MKIVLAALLLMVSSFCFAQQQISFSQENLKGQIDWITGPLNGAESSFLLKMTHSDGSAAELINAPEVDLFMPDMGHGSSPTNVQRVLDDRGNVVAGAYKVVSVWFIMMGTWELKITLTDAQNKTETQVVNYKIR